MTTQQDDFLTQVLSVETKAEKMIEDAKKKIQSDQIKLEKKLKKEREEALSQAKEKAKERFQERQITAKGIYEDLLKEGEREANQLKKDAEKKAETVLNSAEAIFTNEII